MKLSSSNNMSILYRKEKKRKKQKKNTFHRIVRMSVRIFFTIIILSLISFFTIKYLISNNFFTVKKIEIAYINNDIKIDMSKIDNIKSQNILNLKKSYIQKTISEEYPFIGVRNIVKFYPSTLKIILYKKVPLLSINNKYIIYNDKSLYKAKKPIYNTIQLITKEKNINSIYSIPGLATLFNSIINNKDEIKKIIHKDYYYKIKLKNNKTIYLQEGDSIKMLKFIENLSYKKIDLRYKDVIIIKN